MIIESIIKLLSGIAIFMLGIQLLSSSIKKKISGGIKNKFKNLKDKKLKSFNIGLGITTIIQSSGATITLAITGVNIGLLTSIQAYCIVIGANVGTTITGFITAFSSFDIILYLSILTFIGFIIESIFQNEKYKAIGNILTCLGLIFLGLNLMSSSFQNEVMADFIRTILTTISNPFILILISIVITALVQSSSMIVSLAVILVSAGSLNLNSGLYIVIGSNIGTCITSCLASLGLDRNSKRVALFQIIFNVVGSLIFIPLLLLFSNQIVSIIEAIIPIPSFQVAFFHLIFNALTACFFIFLLKPVDKLLNKTFLAHDKKDKKVLEQRLLTNPSMALVYLEEQIQNMFNLTNSNYLASVNEILKASNSESSKILANEELINKYNLDITNYLIELNGSNLAQYAKEEIGKLYHIINDLERIGDHACNFNSIAQILIDKQLTLNELDSANLLKISGLVSKMFEYAQSILFKKDINLLDEMQLLEDNLNATRNIVENETIDHIKSGVSPVELSQIYYKITGQLERIGDHLINIAFTLVSTIGNTYSEGLGYNTEGIE